MFFSCTKKMNNRRHLLKTRQLKEILDDLHVADVFREETFEILVIVVELLGHFFAEERRNAKESKRPSEALRTKNGIFSRTGSSSTPQRKLRPVARKSKVSDRFVNFPVEREAESTTFDRQRESTNSIDLLKM